MAISYDNNIFTDTATNAITTGGTSAGFGLLGGIIGGPLSGPYQQQAYQTAQYGFLNYTPEPQKQAPKHKRFIDELRAEIQGWHGELRAA